MIFQLFFLFFNMVKMRRKNLLFKGKREKKMIKIKNMVKDKMRKKFTSFFFDFILHIRRSVKSVPKSNQVFHQVGNECLSSKNYKFKVRSL